MEKLHSLKLRDQRTLNEREYQRLAQVPPEAQWFANLNSAQTRRAYECDIRAFMAFLRIVRPEEFRQVTRGHVLAWRAELEQQGLAGSTIRRRWRRCHPCTIICVTAMR